MKKIIVLFLYVILFGHIYSQEGLFKTYEDYLANKVTVIGKYITPDGSRITYEDGNGKEYKMKLEGQAIWGFRAKNYNDYRIFEGDNPMLIGDKGKICMYFSQGTRHDPGSGYFEFTSEALVYSLGLNGEMKWYNKKEMLELMSDDPESQAALKKAIGFEKEMPVIMNYNRKFEKKQE